MSEEKNEQNIENTGEEVREENYEPEQYLFEDDNKEKSYFENERQAKIENIIRAIRKNEQSNKNERIRINYKVLIDSKTKFISPFVALSGTAVVAVITYIRHFNNYDWCVAVGCTLVLFLGFGSLLQHFIEKFEIEIVKKEIATRLEQRRKEEEEAMQAAIEAAKAAEESY